MCAREWVSAEGGLRCLQSILKLSYRLNGPKSYLLLILILVHFEEREVNTIWRVAPYFHSLIRSVII